MQFIINAFTHAMQSHGEFYLINIESNDLDIAYLKDGSHISPGMWRHAECTWCYFIKIPVNRRQFFFVEKQQQTGMHGKPHDSNQINTHHITFTINTH